MSGVVDGITAMLLATPQVVSMTGITFAVLIGLPVPPAGAPADPLMGTVRT